MEIDKQKVDDAVPAHRRTEMTQQESQTRTSPATTKEIGNDQRREAKRLLSNSGCLAAVVLLLCVMVFGDFALMFWDSPGPRHWSVLSAPLVVFVGPILVILGTPLLISLALFGYRRTRRVEEQDFRISIALSKIGSFLCLGLVVSPFLFSPSLRYRFLVCFGVLLLMSLPLYQQRHIIQTQDFRKSVARAFAKTGCVLLLGLLFWPSVGRMYDHFLSWLLP